MVDTVESAGECRRQVARDVRPGRRADGTHPRKDRPRLLFDQSNRRPHVDDSIEQCRSWARPSFVMMMMMMMMMT